MGSMPNFRLSNNNPAWGPSVFTFQHNHIFFGSQFIFFSLSMATSIQNLVQPFSCRCPSYISPSIPIAIFPGGRSRNARKMLRIYGAMVEKTVQGASSTFAKEMERLSAKESLLLAVSPYLLLVPLFSD